MARYALEELLRGLGLAPRWVGADGLGEGGLYCGVRPGAAPGGVLVLPLHPDTAAYFASGAPYDPADVTWLDDDGDRIPFLFPRRRAGTEGTMHRAPTDARPDPVASAFFWLSGWQELTTAERDEHGRFPHRVSLQAALGTTDQPTVDLYRARFGAMLAARGVPVRRPDWRGRAWAVCPTHDLDLMRKRRLGTAARALRRTDGRRAQALRQAAFAPDPLHRSVERLAAAERTVGAGATYFVKAGATGGWDVPYRLEAPRLRRTLGRLSADGFELGLHPSYFAHDHLARLCGERDRLAEAVGEQPAAVRQHFLRVDPAATPRLQAEAGFRLDSSLGFARREGFRRGTCHPFRVWDLRAARPLDLWELPLLVMDTTLFTHRGLRPEEAEAAVAGLLGAVRRAGGCGVVLWHNTAYDAVDHPGQGAVFERVLARAAGEGAALLGLGEALDAYLGG